MNGVAEMTEAAMRVTRRAEPDDLAPLLELYLHLNPETPTLEHARANEIWTDMLSRKGVTVFVSMVEAKIVSTCILATVPNLMRGGRPHAVIENVVTHPEYRRQGHGRATIGAALKAAWEQDCHHVMLLTGRADLSVLSFYESCGFERDIKIGFIARRTDGEVSN